jgi:nicotinamidase-related amidase
MEGSVLGRESAVLVVVDVQEKFRQVIHEWDVMLSGVGKLVGGCTVLGVPVVATEQYPKGLGQTVEEIRPLLTEPPIEKLSFSCMGEPKFRERLESLRRRQLILCGIEAHVCVLNTALDALTEGYDVHIAADATSSRRRQDKETALANATQAWAHPTTVETILFQLLEKAGTEEFKQISKIVK